MTRNRLGVFSAAGLFGGALAWGIHQQVGYLIASWACERPASAIWLTGIIAIVILLVGAALSVTALRRLSGGTEAGRPRHFLGLVSIMTSLLFLFALVLQAAAALFLPGCVG
jgi:hypothetical protein